MELQVFKMLADICRAFPIEKNESGKELKCRRPQSFAVLKSLSDLNSENLEKVSHRYTNSGFFFSHKFEDQGRDPSKISFSYPLVGLAYDDFEIAFHSKSKNRFSYNLAILDQDVPDKDDKFSYCANRTMEEQSRDMKRILEMLISQLEKWCYCFNQETGKSLLAHESLIPGGFSCLFLACDMVTSKTIRGSYIRDAYSDNVSGVFTTIEFDFSNCYSGQEWVYSEVTKQVSNNDCELC